MAYVADKPQAKQTALPASLSTAARQRPERNNLPASITKKAFLGDTASQTQAAPLPSHATAPNLRRADRKPQSEIKGIAGESARNVFVSVEVVRRSCLLITRTDAKLFRGNEEQHGGRRGSGMLPRTTTQNQFLCL